MFEETNRTHSASPRDYAMTLRFLSRTQLMEEAQTNYWCWQHLQCQEINYKDRYLLCLALQLQRGHLDNIESPT